MLGSVGSGRRTTTFSTLRQRFRSWSEWVRRQHSPLSLLCITMILRVRRIFFLNYYVPQQWHQSLVLCVDVICTSRTQVSCGRYKSYCLPACHTLVRRYCEMKRPGPTLRVRLRETGFTVASTRCLKVTGGCLSLLEPQAL